MTQHRQHAAPPEGRSCRTEGSVPTLAYSWSEKLTRSSTELYQSTSTSSMQQYLRSSSCTEDAVISRWVFSDFSS